MRKCRKCGEVRTDFAFDMVYCNRCRNDIKMEKYSQGKIDEWKELVITIIDDYDSHNGRRLAKHVAEAKSKIGGKYGDGRCK